MTLAERAKEIATHEREAVRDALTSTSGNVAAAARNTGVSRRSMDRWINETGLRPWLTATYPLSVRQPSAGGHTRPAGSGSRKGQYLQSKASIELRIEKTSEGLFYWQLWLVWTPVRSRLYRKGVAALIESVLAQACSELAGIKA